MYEFALDVGEMTPTVVTMMSMIDITKKFESLHGRYVITKKAKSGDTLYYKGFMKGFSSDVRKAKSYDTHKEARVVSNRVLTSCLKTSVNRQFNTEVVTKVWNKVKGGS